MSALPLFGNSGDLGHLLNGPDQRARIVHTLEERFALTPLDRIDAATLARHDVLILAQPRALGGEELVVLDTWIRAGGHALIFLDDRLGWESAFPVGDRRRPSPMTLLDPLFRHWGLELLPAEGEGESETVAINGYRATLWGAGHWANAAPGCLLSANAVIAQCAIGKGRALLVADADLLDDRHWGAPGTDNASAIVALIDRVRGVSAH